MHDYKFWIVVVKKGQDDLALNFIKSCREIKKCFGDGSLNLVIKDSSKTQSSGLDHCLSQNVDWVTYLSAPDVGIYQAFNQALSYVYSLHAKGFIVFAGLDDLLFASGFAEIYQRYQRFADAPDCIFFPYIAGNRLVKSDVSEFLGRIDIGKMFPGHSISMFIKTDLHAEIGPYAEEFQIAGDSEFFSRLRNFRLSNKCELGTGVSISGYFGVDGISNTNSSILVAELFLINKKVNSWVISCIVFFLRKLKNVKKIFG